MTERELAEMKAAWCRLVEPKDMSDIIGMMRGVITGVAQSYREDGEEEYAQKLSDILPTIHGVDETAALIFMSRWFAAAEEDDADEAAIERALFLIGPEPPPATAAEYIERASKRLDRLF